MEKKVEKWEWERKGVLWGKKLWKGQTYERKIPFYFSSCAFKFQLISQSNILLVPKELQCMCKLGIHMETTDVV